ncbi:metacaspase-1A [Fonsecaea erecta]|uniref:Metacaspase-1A n=1 Tax=Fonsecaea erecta TaxID=1367422 RepID=A0A179A0G6_9EURO|nr:metacaspase-1A [Fonsecaea erecta]OAP65482.1 metacaspase-1A [Fonsecaea erecta]
MSFYPGSGGYGAQQHGGYGYPPQSHSPQPYPPQGYSQGYPPQSHSPQPYPAQGYGAPGGYGQPPPQVAPYGYNNPPPPQQGGYGGYGSPPPQPNGYPGPRPGMPSYANNSYAQGNHQAPPPPPTAPQRFGHGAPPEYSFQYSNCTGKRKALLIGINYFGQRGQLRGCINDVKNMSTYLNQNFGYAREDMVILTDDQQNPMSQPTKANILRAMHWLVKDARPNDSLFFHYSGHGGQTPDLDGDEEDGYDEVIYPVDFRTQGHIVDDEMHRIMVKPLQPGVRLTAIFDSCHSGSALDLPGMASSAMGLFKRAANGNNVYERNKQTKTSPADVIMWSGSKDEQTSQDANIGGEATGAMSWAFVTALKKNPHQSYVQLLNSIRDELASKYTQKPQLSCSHPLNTDLLYVM